MPPADKQEIKISLFTATYNRASTLIRLYESLKRQDTQNFLWEIIDDGSTDNTRETIRGFIREELIRISYQRIDHGGKHSAFNAYLNNTLSDITVEIDSDDELLPNAVSMIKKHWEQSILKGEDLFSIFYGCIEASGNYVGKSPPQDPHTQNFRKFNFSRTYRAEKLRTFRTQALKSSRFSSRYEGNPNVYIPESTFFLRVSRDRLSRFYIIPLRVYHKDTISIMRHNKGWRWNVEGMTYGLLETLNLAGTYLIVRRPLLLIRYALNYSRFSYIQHERAIEQLSRVTSPAGRVMVAIVLPVARIRAYLDTLGTKINK